MMERFSKGCLFVGALGLFALFGFVGGAIAEPLNFDLADDYVEITSGFTGSDLVIFGNKGARGEVVVILEGPERDSVVRRKERILGAWINSASLRFEDTPLYYDYAISGGDEAALMGDNWQDDRRFGISALMFTPEKTRYDVATTKFFQEGLLRNQQDDGLYPRKAKVVSFLGDGLFRADFHVPSNVPSGEYRVRALLIDDGQIVYERSQEFRVGLTGFSASVYEFGKNYSFLYGVFCVLIACFAGWLSNILVQRN